MNYPKPDIFDPTPKETAKGYISVPGYKFVIEAKTSKFLDPAAFMPLNGDGWQNGDDESSFVRHSEIAQPPAQPFELIISNIHHRPVNATLFHSFYNSTSQNFGNPLPIIIRPNDNNLSYLQYLKQTENVPYRIGAIQYEIISKPDSVSDITVMESFNLRWNRVDANGTPSPVYYIPIRTSPQQFIQSIVQVQSMAELILDGCAGFNIDMPAHTVVKLTFYPLAQQNIQRLLARRQDRALAKMQAREAKLQAKLEAINRRRGNV
jgi:hypothetical protein